MKYIVLLLGAALLFGSCKKKSEDCGSVAGSTVVSDAEKALVTNYLAANPDPAAVPLENSGLYYSISVAGDTKKPGQCDIVGVKYVGKLQNGTIFDQSGANTVSFQLGGLIEGWRRSLPLIGAGGKMKLYIPPSLGYGPNGLINPQTGAIIIPANQIIIFEMELVSIN